MEKFLIYKVSGGLNHMLIQINNAVELSKMSNRKLIIDCESGAFNSNFNDYFEITDFEHLTSYENLKDVKTEIIESTVRYDNKKYLIGDTTVNLYRKEIIHSSEKFLLFTYLNDRIHFNNWHIKIKKDILEKVKNKEIKGDYIGVHFRNTDMKHDLKEIIQKVKQINHINRIYLSTDDFSSIHEFEQTLQTYEIIRNTTPFDNSGKNIHYGNPNKNEVIMNTLIDMYCLMNSTEFIPSKKSSLSKRVQQLRKINNFFI